MTRVLLVTSIGPTCGIAEHSRQLVQHLPAEAGIRVHATERALDPAWALEYLQTVTGRDTRVLHLNYHRGLHSRWTGPVLQAVKAEFPELPIVVTWHDTYETHPPEDPIWQVASAVDRVVVHEPCDLLSQRPGRTTYWRQGVPDPAPPLELPLDGSAALQPILGVFGHDFPWKNFDRVAEIAADVGWGFCHVGPRLSPAREEALRRCNPAFVTVPDPSSALAVSALSGCNATAFMYTCANSGTSGAIRWGLATGKPVFAQRGCRQFRDLEQLDRQRLATEDEIPTGIGWTTLEDLSTDLVYLSETGPWDYRSVRTRTLESWTRLGRKYADLYLGNLLP